MSQSSARRRSTAWARRRLQPDLEGRGNVKLDELEAVSKTIVEQGNQTDGLERTVQQLGSEHALALSGHRPHQVPNCWALQVSDVFNTLQVYLGSYYVNNFNEFGRTWQVNVQADPKFRDKRRRHPETSGPQQPRDRWSGCGTLMDVRNTSGPVMVMRYNMYSAASITGNAAAGHRVARQSILLEEIARTRTAAMAMQLEWTELAYLQNQAGNTAMWFFALAVVFVFLVLAAQYESWKLPLAVILVVPMCLLCSLVGVQIGGIEVTIFTQIGFVVLVGLACKNAILIVEFAKQQQEAGVPLREATLEATRLRLRPILMTSFAFIFGVVPLVIRPRGRRRNAPLAGAGRLQRHAGRDDLRHLPDAGFLLFAAVV